MSRQNLRQAIDEANGTQMAAPTQHKTIAHLLVDPQVKQQMAAALPRHMTADRLARVMLTEVRKVPKLAECDQMSFLGAVMQAAQLGLEPGAALGHCYLIPFDKRAKVGNSWQVVATEVQLIIGYRGMLDLARRSGQIVSIEARAIYTKDYRKIRLGLDSILEHEPAWEETDRGAPQFFYAVAKLRDGGTQFEVMSVAEINAIRDASQGFQAAVRTAARNNKEKPDTPWVTHYDEMAKKTVIRRLFKYLPVSIEMQRAVGLDELGDIGKQQNALVIDANYQLPAAQQSRIENEYGGGEAVEQDMAQLIHDAMVAATSEDELNSAWELGGPDYKHPPELATFYNDRLKQLA